VQGYKIDKSKYEVVADTIKGDVKSIVIKSNNLTDAKSMSKNMDDVTVLKGNSIVINSDGKKASPLIFVDGEKMTQKEMDAMSPDQIKSVEILKGESAIKAYGAEAKDGVIKITTKKKVNL
jgi:outer membrane receptor for ferrienterochelin and colicin